MRKIIIKYTQKNLRYIKDIVNLVDSEFKKRNTEIIYSLSTKFSAALYGYDGKIKSRTKIPENIPKFIQKIDNMSMGKRELLLRKCNLPNTKNTSHCFNDNTHHTCCMLGPKARLYADQSGNPIGITSEEAFSKRYGRKPSKNERTSWCTCTGSKVCSYYRDRFNDGTDIKFIGNTKTINEDKGINMLKINRHRTPGVY